MEQVVGIEPTSSAWKAEVLPLNYTCISHSQFVIINYFLLIVNTFLKCFRNEQLGGENGKAAGTPSAEVCTRCPLFNTPEDQSSAASQEARSRPGKPEAQPHRGDPARGRCPTDCVRCEGHAGGV